MSYPTRILCRFEFGVYEPLVASLEEPDTVSLAQSLMGEGDERIIGELEALFDEEGLWQ